jgi:DNA-binding winged helix-turn-helix (wHTH) protein
MSIEHSVPEIISIHGTSVNTRTGSITIKGTKVRLTEFEQLLVQRIASRRGLVATHAMCLAVLNPQNKDTYCPKSTTVLLSRIRKQLGTHNVPYEVFETILGRGIRLNIPPIVTDDDVPPLPSRPLKLSGDCLVRRPNHKNIYLNDLRRFAIGSTKTWTAEVKLAFLMAYMSGKLSGKDALDTYLIDRAEWQEWRISYMQRGKSVLQVTS